MNNSNTFPRRTGCEFGFEVTLRLGMNDRIASGLYPDIVLGFRAADPNLNSFKVPCNPGSLSKSQAIAFLL